MADYVGNPARNVWPPPVGSAQNGGKVVAKGWTAIALTQGAYCPLTPAGSTRAATRRSPERGRSGQSWRASQVVAQRADQATMI